MRYAFPAILVLAALASPAAAESGYDQPYLGKDNEQWKTFVHFRAWDAPIPDSLAESVRAADVILIGDASSLKVIPAKPGENRSRYAADVKIAEVLKGKLDAKSLPLEWVAATTGIEDKPAASTDNKLPRHVFFLVKGKDSNWEVRRALFVFPYAEYPKMVLYGAYDVEQTLGFMAIRYFLDDKGEFKDLKAGLMKSYESAKWGDFYCAATLATELDLKYGEDMLKKIAATDGNNFDMDLYAHAVQSFAARGGAGAVKSILAGIPALRKREGLGRLPESAAFHAIGALGKNDAVPVIGDFIKANPQYAVSAAWALAEIGGNEARTLVETWRKDPTISGAKEKVSNGMMAVDAPAADLLDGALAHFSAK